MSVLLNNAELERLYGQIPDVWVFYVVLKKFMDYRTGLVGVARGISWQSLSEEMYVEPEQGLRDTGTPHKSRVRRLSERAQKAGLIEDRSHPKKLIFFMPLASTDDSAQKKPDTNPTQTRHTHPDTSDSSSGESCNGKSGGSRQVDFSKGTGEPDTPPYIRISVKEEPPHTPPCRFALPDSVDPSVWDEFEQHRREIRKPLTDLARTKNAETLAKLTPSQQRQAVEDSIRNRWTGVFPPKGIGHAAHQPSRKTTAAERADQWAAECWGRISGATDPDLD